MLHQEYGSTSKDDHEKQTIPAIPPSLEPTKTHHSDDNDNDDADDDHHFEHDQLQPAGKHSSPVVGITKEPTVKQNTSPPADVSGREKLKRHRIEVAGRVSIPDSWGQEELLKDWIDCSAFDSSLFPTGIMSARAALVQEGKRANSGGLSIENRCS